MTAPSEMVLPFAIDSLGRVAFTTDPEQQVVQHVRLLLGTRLNERFMSPAYGLDSFGYVFGVLDDATLQRLQIEVEHVLSDWEPAVLLHSVDVVGDDDTGSITIAVAFSIQGVSVGNLSVHTATIQVGGSVVSARV